MKRSYIAYLDLLGIKEQIILEPSRYMLSINAFRNTMFDSCISLGLNEKDFSIYFFSDCAFIEAKDLKNLFSFLIILRRDLFANSGLFFKGAINSGELKAVAYTGAKEDIQNIQGNELKRKLEHVGKRAVGILFDSGDISDVYTQQLILKGIGINVNHNILQHDNNYLNLIDDYIVKSIFLPEVRSDSINSYYDLKLHGNELNEAMFNRFLQFYFITNSKDKKLGRYYLSYLCTYINSGDFRNLEFSDESGEFYINKKGKPNPSEQAAKISIDALLVKNKYPTFNKLYDEAMALDALYMVLLNKMYLDKKEDMYTTTKLLEILFSYFNKIKKKYLYNLNKIPTSLVEPKNRLKLFRDYEALVAKMGSKNEA
jgi:hypothetical protein